MSQLFSEEDNVILAEINHLSSVKVGNILSRDHFRDYELSFLSPGGDAIPLSDVTIRLEKGEIVLRAISIGRKIQPRMTTAHNYRNNTSAVYRFLCDIQSERIVPGLSFMWCGLDALYRRLPRVVYRDIILSPATWYLDTPIQSNNRNIDRQLIIDWAKSNKLPRRVLYIVGDNKLLIDFSCNLSVDSFVSELPKSGIIEIQEYFEPSGYVQDEKNQNYCNEFLIPLLRQS